MGMVRQLKIALNRPICRYDIFVDRQCKFLVSEDVPLCLTENDKTVLACPSALLTKEEK